MKRFKKVVAMMIAIFMMTMNLCQVVHAAPPPTPEVKLYGTVTDAGEVVNKVVIDYSKVTGSYFDDHTIDPTTVTTDTFAVNCKGTNPASYNVPTTETSYNAKQFDRNVVKTEVDGDKIVLYLDESEGGTLTYLANGARNIPLDLEYKIIQKQNITCLDQSGTPDVNPLYFVDYICDNTVIDDETAKYTKVAGSQGINYQYHEGTSDSLVIWFHGNGEGDYNGSKNNVAQMLANRGTVAWSTPEAQSVFGDASVMAFQAPDTWYYAQRDGLLQKAYDEIQEVIKDKGIDPSKVYVSGCSAGGYMTTRMIIAYPDLFKAAMINCPALDVATSRGGQTPTDEELKGVKNSRTAIWLVQADNDETVKTADCSQRFFNILTEGQTLKTTNVSQYLYSNFTTTETSDDKYKLSLYDTNNDKKLSFAEDYDQDGVNTEVTYSNHWSWIYTLLNNPKDASGTHIWNWAVNYQAPQPVVKPNTPTINNGTGTTTTTKPVQSAATGDNSALELYTALATFTVLAGGYIVFKNQES